LGGTLRDMGCHWLAQALSDFSEANAREKLDGKKTLSECAAAAPVSANKSEAGLIFTHRARQQMRTACESTHHRGYCSAFETKLPYRKFCLEIRDIGSLSGPIAPKKVNFMAESRKLAMAMQFYITAPRAATGHSASTQASGVPKCRTPTNQS
jgi:hypothetical protein